MDPLPDDRMLMQRKYSRFLASAAPVALSRTMGAFTFGVFSAGLLAATPALADTTISTGTTQTLNTATAGNITIAGTGTLTGAGTTTLTTATTVGTGVNQTTLPVGTVVSTPTITINSSNNVTVNGGGIIYAGTATSPLNFSTAIAINPGVTTTVTNAGAIYALENFTPTTISGAFVESAVSGVYNRYGIYGAAGGVINGSISNNTATTIGSNTYTGTIAIDGENSAGIQIDGTLNGSLSTEGNITVLGDNSYGVKLNAVTANTATNSAATGNVTIGGVVTVTGSGAQGYVQSGNVAGIILLDGAISNSTSYTDTQGTSLTLTKSGLNSGPSVGGNYFNPGTAPIVEIDGSVAGGIVINAPTTSTSTDSNRGSITAYGNNPALQIGGANAITIGANANTDNGSLNPNTNSGSFALGIDGTVTASAAGTSGVAAYGVVIGGRGGAVTLTGGMEIYGTVSVTTSDTAATAILIQPGSTVGTIFNSGTIKAAAASNNQVSGNVYAIQDLSGTVTSFTNQGNISVSASPQAGSTVAAIDLSHTSSAITLTQSYTVANQTNETTDEAATGYNPLTATLYAGITGDIYLGTGANTVNINSGGVTGNLYLGAGSTNTITAGDVTRWVGNINVGSSGGAGTLAMTLNNYAQFNTPTNGAVNFFNGTGASSLTLNNSASFLGTVLNAPNLAVAVNGGTFGANALGTSTIGSLNVASGAALRVFVDGTSGSSSLLLAKSATFQSGAVISLAINSLTNVVGKYDVLTATTLTGASTLTNSSFNLPVLFTGSVSTDANDVYVTIAHATAAQLGLTSAQTAAYQAILNDASSDNNTNLQSTLLLAYDTPTLRGRFNELLPDYAGGTFDVVTRATRIADKHFDDDSTMFSISQSSAWLEPIVFHGTRTFGDTPGFKTSGGGISTGFEKATPIGNVGFELAWLTGSAKADTYQKVDVGEFELGLFWRKSAGPLYLWAGGNLGRETFDAKRTFNGEFTTSTTTAINTTYFQYHAGGHWAGWSAAFNGGASYTLALNEHFSLRPRGVVEYDRLQENSYIESGDNPIALTVLGRVDTQTTATGTLTAQWSAGPSTHEGRPFSVAVEAGRRTWVSGNLGTTTATFETGDTFSINGGHLPSAWLGNLSISQGGLDYTWKIGTDVERGTDKGIAYGIRASIAVAL